MQLEFNFLVNQEKGINPNLSIIKKGASIMNELHFTVQDNMERPDMINRDHCVKKIKSYLDQLFTQEWKNVKRIRLWDGKSAKQIINHIFNP